MTGIADAEAALTAVHGRHWDLYRRMDGDWGLTVKEPVLCAGRSQSVQGPDLVSVMTAALDIRFRPQVPRRPWTPDLVIEKDGSRWWVRDRVTNGNYGAKPTKRAATETVELVRARAVELALEWDRDWAPVVAAGVEGRDWEWSTNH